MPLGIPWGPLGDPLETPWAPLGTTWDLSWSILAPCGGYVGTLAPFRAAFFTFVRFSGHILKIFHRFYFIFGQLFVLQRASRSFAETGFADKGPLKFDNPRNPAC